MAITLGQQTCAVLLLWLVIRGVSCSSDTSSAMLYTAKNLIRFPVFPVARRLRHNTSDALMDTRMAACASLALMERASLAFILVCLSNDVEVNPGPIANPTCSASANATPQSISMSASGFRICQWNVRSYNNDKFEEIRSLLINSKTHQLDMLIISETWLDDTVSDAEIYIPGFRLERKDRVGRKGGGILMYIANNVTYTRAPNFESVGLELISVKVTPFKSNCPLFVVGTYRPPDSSSELDQQLKTTLEQLYLTNKEVLLLGDMNINTLDKGQSKHRLIKALSNLGLHQLIHEVTRPSSHACLDHAYTTHPQHVIRTKVCNIGLSDHLPVCIVRKHQKRLRGNSHIVITYRDYKNFQEQAFRDDLEHAAWNVLDMFDDPDDAADYFNKTFLSVADAHAPLVQKRVKKQRQPLWMTPDIYSEIRHRDQLLKKARQSDVLNDWKAYKNARNTTFRSIREAKSQHFKKSFENSQSPREFWKHLKNVTGSVKKPPVSKIKVNESIVYDPTVIANTFNEFFVSVASSYRANTPAESTAADFEVLRNFVQSKVPTRGSFDIPKITDTLVQKHLNNLEVNKATGLDRISARLLRTAAPAIAAPLAKVFNLSIVTGTFPDSWKLAKVCPVYKAGDHLCVNNYRPISVLPVLSKILERHVHSSLYEYLTKYHLLSTRQSGFRAYHSCETAMIELVDNLLTNMDNGLISGLNLIDYRKAFDLVDHTTLLSKLNIYRLSQSSLGWFSSYLEHRHQKVTIQGHLSCSLPITAGVPQGSILGPLLFIVFINDLPLLVSQSSIQVYADDTTQFASGNTIEEVESTLSEELNQIVKWARDNKMVLNRDKTKSMVVCSKPKWKKLEKESKSLKVVTDNQPIEIVSSTKLLGIYLDNNLSWDTHVEHVKRKVSQRLGLLKRTKQFLTIEARSTFYHSLIQPVLDYGATIWGGASLSHANELLQLQKRSARIILDVPWDTPSAALFKRLNITPFHKRVNYLKLRLVFKALNGSTPLYIRNKFTLLNEIHSINTRNSSSNFLLPKVNRSFGKKTFYFSAACLWNTLPKDVKQASTISSFSRKLDNCNLD